MVYLRVTNPSAALIAFGKDFVDGAAWHSASPHSKFPSARTTAD